MNEDHILILKYIIFELYFRTDIQERREQVLKRYVEFKESARIKREKLEDSRRYQYFRRDAEELESC